MPDSSSETQVRFSQSPRAKEYFERLQRSGQDSEKPFSTAMEFYWICAMLGIRWSMPSSPKESKAILAVSELTESLRTYKDSFLGLWFYNHCADSGIEGREEVSSSMTRVLSGAAGASIPSRIINSMNDFSYGGFLYIKNQIGDLYAGADFLVALAKLFEEEPSADIRALSRQ